MTDMTNLTDMTTSLQTFSLLAPEIALVLAAIVAFLAGAFAGLRSGWLVALVGIAAAMALAAESYRVR